MCPLPRREWGRDSGFGGAGGGHGGRSASSPRAPPAAGAAAELAHVFGRRYPYTVVATHCAALVINHGVRCGHCVTIGVAVGTFQAVQHMAADAHVQLIGARNALWAAAWRLDHLGLDALSVRQGYHAAAAHGEAQADMLWRIRDGISEAERAIGPAMQHDISVPVADRKSVV